MSESVNPAAAGTTAEGISLLELVLSSTSKITQVELRDQLKVDLVRAGRLKKQGSTKVDNMLYLSFIEKILNAHGVILVKKTSI